MPPCDHIGAMPPTPLFIAANVAVGLTSLLVCAVPTILSYLALRHKLRRIYSKEVDSHWEN